MKSPSFPILWLAAALAFLGGVGCRRPGPPPPLPAEQIPAALQQVFGTADAEVRGVVAELEAALKSKDYTAAYQHVQRLCNLPDATQEQRTVATRAMLTLTSLLQSAQAQGDQNAAAALKDYQRSR